jgi:hypothetical protein
MNDNIDVEDDWRNISPLLPFTFIGTIIIVTYINFELRWRGKQNKEKHVSIVSSV